MYRGFRLILDDASIKEIKKLNQGHKPVAKLNVDLDIDSVLDSQDANWIMDTWFPNYDADIFLSHSHNDCELTRKLADQLERMGLKVFVDSEVWRYASELLRKIDDTYCVKNIDADGSKIYAYERRNKSTAHVYIMLAHALTRMIDLTECFIFLDTLNSSITASRNRVETLSPWLYHELTIARIIARRPCTRFGKFAEDTSLENLNESMLNLKYKADTKGLMNVSYSSLQNIMRKVRIETAFYGTNGRRGAKFLDSLYQDFKL